MNQKREKFSDKLLKTLAPGLAALVIRFLHLTMRTTYVNFDSYRERLKDGGQIILAFWHGRLLMMPYSYPGRGISILVSQSSDGELIARTVRSFGIESVRGSSSRGWFGGIKGLLKSVRDGRDLAITPDGPRGPKQVAQMGTIQIARATGLPVYPMSFGVSKKKPSRAGTPSFFPTPSLAGSLSAASL